MYCHKFINMGCPHFHMIILIFLIDYEQELSTTFQRLKKSKISIIDILISLFIIFFIHFFSTSFGLYTQPRWVEREGEREGGTARRPETGVREGGIPRPSCSSRAQVGCACSRGLQASTWERERAASSERLSRPRPRAANPL
jgi:hypothetical protein